jgi:hypothetical protein
MEATRPVTAGSGRKLLWLGVLCVVVGIPIYVLQLIAAGWTVDPWYIPVLGTVGVLLAIISLRMRPTLWRGVASLLIAALAGFQWWFIVGYARLPAYAGPIVVGKPFPEFRAAKADGAPFTRADLPGDRATALVFFRGHW